MFQTFNLILSIIAIQSYDCRTVKRDTPFGSTSSYSQVSFTNKYNNKKFTSQPLLRSTTHSPAQTTSSPIILSSETYFQDSFDNSKVTIQSTSFSSNNHQPSIGDSQPRFTSIPYDPISISKNESSVRVPRSQFPVEVITALLLPALSGGSKASNDEGSSGLFGGVSGIVGAASGGLKTALEIKRDIIIPIIVGIIEFIKNIASSETIQTIANIKLSAAKTALSVGPQFIEALAGIASSAGEITGSLINLLLCSVICPLQEDSNSCKIQASCGGTPAVNTVKTTFSSGKTYIIN